MLHGTIIIYLINIFHTVSKYSITIFKDVSSVKKIVKMVPLALMSLIITTLSFYAVSILTRQYAMVSAGIIDTPVLIIDAGHGGADGGAVAADGTTESVINLEICLKMRDICALFGIDPVLTRETEDIDYPQSADTISKMKKADTRARCDLINSFDNAVLISIHQNKFPSSKASGLQALYAKTDGSAAFADIIRNGSVKQLGEDNVRVSAKIKDSVYLMNNISCTAVLVECGFISNSGDLNNLENSNYKTKLAYVFISSYLEYNSTVKSGNYA